MPQQYQAIDGEEFEQFLNDFVEYEEAHVRNVNERVFDLPLPVDDLTVRVFSTISTGSNSGRDRGEDSIKCVIWDHNSDGPIGGEKKTLRIGPTDSNPDGWQGNLRPKIESLYANWRNYNKKCSCGSRMAVREGEYGKFWGCMSYPNCRNTESY